MRYVALLVSIPGCLGLATAWGSVVSAATPYPDAIPPAEFQISQAVSEEASASPDFWPQAAEFVQQQMYWADRAEEVLAQADPNPVRMARSRILANVIAVEQFLERQYPAPTLLCSPIDSQIPAAIVSPEEMQELQAQRAASIGLTPAQVEIYCQLRETTQRLETIVPILERRVLMLSDVAEVRPVTLPTEPYRDRTLGIAVEQQRLAQPTVAVSGPEPELPVAPNRVLDLPQKDAIAGYQPPTPPAVALPRQAAVTLQAVKQQLREMQARFPTAFEFTDPEEGDRIDERNTFELHPQETEFYAAWMSEPGQGMARIHRAEAYHRPPNELWNRTEPDLLDRYPFSLLTLNPGGAETGQFVPRLALQVQNDEFQMFPSVLDYGFILDLGDIPLENLTADSPEFPEFFRTYQPPTQLDALQSDQRQFTAGKMTTLPAEVSARSQAPVILNHTYVARLIQYNLPEFVSSGRPPSREEQARIMELLHVSGADVLVAFRPVNRRPDGSYTVLWKVLTEMPDPRIEDLAPYVQASP